MRSFKREKIMTRQTINPATEKVIATYQEMSSTEVDGILEKVTNAQRLWKDILIAQRTEKMRTVAKLLAKNQEKYAQLITAEMGKPISLALNEIKKCQWVCNYYADNAAEFLKPKTIKTELKKSYVAYEPLGTILAIMPWNYPFWQVFRFAAPNLMAGNGCILSHAPISTGASLAIESIFKDAGFPENIFRSVIINNDVAKYTIEHDLIAAVTLTGSERAGRSVAATAGAALKKVVLELGGSDPYVVLADADLDLAVDQVIKSRMNNSGQVCISAKRVIVESAIHDLFIEKICNQLKDYTFGDPSNEATKIGPLARKDLRATVQEQVENAVASGARCLMGGKIPDGTGFYYPPTLLTHVKPGNMAFDEEIFGPVISVCIAKDEADAISLANQSRYGLSGVVFTKDIEKGEKIAREQMQVGTCFVNGMVSSDPRLPFGGIKASGFGRELSCDGIHEFMNIKTIGVA